MKTQQPQRFGPLGSARRFPQQRGSQNADKFHPLQGKGEFAEVMEKPLAGVRSLWALHKQQVSGAVLLAQLEM